MSGRCMQGNTAEAGNAGSTDRSVGLPRKGKRDSPVKRKVWKKQETGTDRSADSGYSDAIPIGEIFSFWPERKERTMAQDLFGAEDRGYAVNIPLPSAGFLTDRMNPDGNTAYILVSCCVWSG